MTNIFKDAVVVITGGASGIGQSLSSQLVKAGAKVIVVGRRDKPNAVLGDYMQADMTDASRVEVVLGEIVSKYGRIDYMFNNAGVFMAGEIRDTPIGDWQKVVNNNIWAVYNGTHYAYQLMLKQGSGHIVNVASAAGLFPVPVMSIYGSSKFAIVGLTQALRNEAKSLGIKVTAACPTVVNTPLYDTATYEKVNAPKALMSRATLQTPEVAAKRILSGVAKNKGIVHTAFSTKVGWVTYRIAPWLYNLIAQGVHGMYRKKLRLK